MSALSISITVGLMVVSIASILFVLIWKPWNEKVTLFGVFFVYLVIFIFAALFISTITFLLPHTIKIALTNLNTLFLRSVFVITCGISITTSLIVISNTHSITPFIIISVTRAVQVVVLLLTGFLVIWLQILSLLPTQLSVVTPVILILFVAYLVTIIFYQIPLILNNQRLTELTRKATFDHLARHPAHYPHLRNSICSIWTDINNENTYPDMSRDYSLLSEKLQKEYQRSKDRILFFTQDMSKYLRELNIADKTGMTIAVSCICKLSVYHPGLAKKKCNNFKIKKQMLHDLIYSCNSLLRQTDNWDVVHENDDYRWEVLHGYRVLELLLIKSMETVDYDLISSTFRMVYTTLLRNHKNINATLFGSNALNDISLIKWIQDRMEKALSFPDDRVLDESINLRLISYSSIIRICVGRIDKLIAFLQDSGEDDNLVTRCNNLIEILIEQIHSLALSVQPFHKKVAVSLFFLIACFAHYRYSQLNADTNYIFEIWKKLEHQSRFMIKYHIGSSPHKGIDFFTSYVCMLQFLRYNPIPLIPWKVRNYTFIEIETLMDDLLGYFERYLIYLDPDLPIWERNFISDNMTEPNWIFFNSPTVTIDLLNVYVEQFATEKKVANKQAYSDFMGGHTAQKVDLKPRFMEDTREDLRSTQIN